MKRQPSRSPMLTIRAHTRAKVSKERIPFGVWVIALAKVAHLSRYLLWSALIALSLFGLSLLVAFATQSTFPKKIYHLFRDGTVQKDTSSPQGVLPSLDLTY